MKNKKLLYLGGLILLVVLIILGIVIFGKKDTSNNDDNNKRDNAKSLVEVALNNIKKDSKEADYKKFADGDILNEDTCFGKYTFISNNSIYIFNPQKLKTGELSYKKVFDIPSDINVTNITPSWGADVKFYDNNDTLYTLHDENTDNKVVDSYDMYEKATYKLNDYLKWTYSTEYLGQKIDYDFMSEYVYVKDNILYYKNYGNNKYPNIEKVSGNYEGEKVIRIYNERILKTDKGFYEIIRYFDNDLGKEVLTTSKISLLSKYYDEVLTFTYAYVILKDYTLIPINDIMVNRFHKYQNNYFLDRPNDNELPINFEE